MEKIKCGPQTLLYPMPAVLVGANVNEKANFMTAAWCGIASQKPPAVSVAIRKNRHTLVGIRSNETFSINVPSSDMVKETDYCGLYSGKENDKSQTFRVFYGTLKTAPLIRESPVNHECKVIHYLDMGSHILVIGEITETYIDDSCMIQGETDTKKIDPLIYIPGTSKYHRLGEPIAAAFQIGKER